MLNQDALMLRNTKLSTRFPRSARYEILPISLLLTLLTGVSRASAERPAPLHRQTPNRMPFVVSRKPNIRVSRSKRATHICAGRRSVFGRWYRWRLQSECANDIEPQEAGAMTVTKANPLPLKLNQHPC